MAVDQPHDVDSCKRMTDTIVEAYRTDDIELSDRDVEFIDSLDEKWLDAGREPTEKQFAWLLSLYQRATKARGAR